MSATRIWLRIEDGAEEANAEATLRPIQDGWWVVEWDVTAVGLVTGAAFPSLDDAEKWLTGQGFADFTA